MCGFVVHSDERSCIITFCCLLLQMVLRVHLKGVVLLQLLLVSVCSGGSHPLTTDELRSPHNNYIKNPLIDTRTSSNNYFNEYSNSQLNANADSFIYDSDRASKNIFNDNFNVNSNNVIMFYGEQRPHHNRNNNAAHHNFDDNQQIHQLQHEQQYETDRQRLYEGAEDTHIYKGAGDHAPQGKHFTWKSSWKNGKKVPVLSIR